MRSVESLVTRIVSIQEDSEIGSKFFVMVVLLLTWHSSITLKVVQENGQLTFTLIIADLG